MADRATNSHKAYLGLGANLGETAAQIKQAVQHLALDDAIQVVKISSNYQSPPLTLHQNQAVKLPWYTNAVCAIRTGYSAYQLLNKIKHIEWLLGRRPSEQWASRTIDIDILFYDRAIIESPRLTIPHPGMLERRFVLEPLKEIAPKLVHPQLKKTITALWEGHPAWHS